jgi:1,4-alpha-glucan branching enzyme
VDVHDSDSSVLSFLRRGGPGTRPVLVALNFTPTARTNYRLGVPRGGRWRESLNSDAQRYGGAGWGNFGGVEAAPVAAHGRPSSLTVTLPGLSALFFTCETPD